eukprot:464939_1
MSNHTTTEFPTLDFTTTQFYSTTNVEHQDDILWSRWASIIYFSTYIIVMVIFSIHIFLTKNYDKKKHFLKVIWATRAIYGQILAHLYDTATDVGVLVEWYILAYDDTDYKSIDMYIMFWASIGFLAVYRILCMVFACFTTDSKDNHDHGFAYKILDFCLGIVDMYIIKTVYLSLKYGHEEPTQQQKAIQLLESIFESLPQVVLQSVFMIRSWNDLALQDNSSIELVAASLAASLFSITNKFIWLDKDTTGEDPDWKAGCPCINPLYAMRVIWRFSFVATRFCVLSLLWSVLGGAFLGMFILISFVVWSVSFAMVANNGKKRKNGLITESISWGLISLVATPPTGHPVHLLTHGIEVIVTLTTITIFAYVEFDCSMYMCADVEDRQASNNPYIEMFIIAGWISMVIDFVSYFYLFVNNTLQHNSWEDVFDKLEEGLEEPDETKNYRDELERKKIKQIQKEEGKRRRKSRDKREKQKTK